MILKGFTQDNKCKYRPPVGMIGRPNASSVTRNNLHANDEPQAGTAGSRSGLARLNEFVEYGLQLILRDSWPLIRNHNRDSGQHACIGTPLPCRQLNFCE